MPGLEQAPFPAVCRVLSAICGLLGVQACAGICTDLFLRLRSVSGQRLIRARTAWWAACAKVWLMTLAARRQAIYADLLALPSHVVGEIVDGEVVVSPRPAMPHAGSATTLGATLLPPFQFGDGGGPGGWRIFFEPELHLNEDVLVPDLAGWRRERMPNAPTDAFVTLAPDWVCEVISPSTSRHDRTKKLPIYARAGVPHLWLLDPLAQTLEVYRLDAGHWVLLAAHGGEETVRAVPFESVAIDLRRLWG
jgi:hypothetical protein